jgi:hypothetical protein
MSGVTTEIDTVLDALSVKISWTAPDHNSDAITSYEIRIREADGVVYSESAATCDGSDATILA